MLSIYARNSGCRRATELVQKTLQKHGGKLHESPGGRKVDGLPRAPRCFRPSSGSRPSSGIEMLETCASEDFLPIAVPNSF
eukprot:2215617-Pyramimonas_sp.AAC.1